MRTGYVVFAHGSTVESANDEVRSVVAAMAQLGGLEMVVASFLEGGRPGLVDSVGSLVSKGAGRICIVPYFLTSGLHLKRDLPALVDECTKLFPGLDVRVSGPLDGHPALARILLDRALAISAAPAPAEQ